MKRSLCRLSACAVVLLAAPALADTDDASPVSEVVVTATRLPMQLDQSTDVHVIDRAEIETRGAVFAEDVLETVPGLSIAQNGAYGGITSISIRGASSDKTLVLVDGVPADDPSQPAGSFDFGGFDLSDIERIEVLNGPQGALWGSNAVGGVIAFTTREPNGLDAMIETGSYNTTRGSIALGQSTQRYALGLTASAISTQGISSADASNGNAERDGFYGQTVGANARLNPVAGVELEAKLRWSESKSGIDGFVPPLFVLADTNDVFRRETWTGLLRATIDDPFGDKDTLSWSDYRENRSTAGESGDFPFDADRQVWRLTTERGKPDDAWGFVAGAEREDTRAELSDASHQEAAVDSLFAVGRWSPVKHLTLSGSLRRDDADHFDPVTTARASAVFDLGGGFSVNASWGQGFKVPTISELACDFCFPAGPATNLKPERATGWDGGVKWRSVDGRFEVDITGFSLDVHDEIDFVFDPSTFDFRYQNIDHARSVGVEAEASATLAPGLVARVSGSDIDAIDLATGSRQLRVPKYQGAGSLEWTRGRGRAALIVRAEGDQADAGGVRPGFVTADATGGWKLTDKLEATLRVTNLFDRHYEEALGYGEPRRAGFVGLRLRY